MKQRRAIRSPRPRRVVIRACIFLLLGAIVNIAVAWGCAVGATTSAYPLSSPVYGEKGSLLAITVGEKHGGRQFFTRFVSFDNPYDVIEIDSTTFKSLYPSWFGCDDGELSPPTLDHSHDRFLQERATGWPCLSLREWTVWQALPNQFLHDEDHGSLSLERWLSPFGVQPAAVPLLPVWSGFAINTLFYAAILWLLSALPGALRRRRRIKRGLCPVCAYPVGTSPVCTECGEPVTVRSVEPESS